VHEHRLSRPIKYCNHSDNSSTSFENRHSCSILKHSLPPSIYNVRLLKPVHQKQSILRHSIKTIYGMSLEQFKATSSRFQIFERFLHNFLHKVSSIAFETTTRILETTSANKETPAFMHIHLGLEERGKKKAGFVFELPPDFPTSRSSCLSS
jgi:hypothetical protein